ncbi:uncharacterized protein LOC6526258 [Drosophila yakuba]|uniref:CHK kinase-like domain-containing protein n=1 Tax=Drosophila yakuba TaxID=7245 RepID=B4P296_DROYA|nr:uncharacterized protein LOC6526258 [Drosophila yakuba]EDW87092.2 uncharacterized protein Dyak_GE16427 [Drosophila yakuba]
MLKNMATDKLPDIRELSKVVEPHFSGARLLNYQTSKLTKPGDNYGSVLLAIHAQLQKSNGEQFEEQLVAKVPPSDPKYWQFFQPERTRLAENAVYKILAPALAVLQDEAGVPSESHFKGFPRFYGCRESLDSYSSKVDHNAVLVLENLRSSGYVSGQRLKAFDMAHTLLALEYMAEFHALPLALRTLKPEVFREQVQPFFKKFDWHAKAPEWKSVMKAETLEDIRRATNNDSRLVARMKELSDQFFEFLAAAPDRPDGPFTSIIHCDFWINNLMFRYGPSGTPTALKIIDFQTAQYDSVVHDIISFLLSSVDTAILEIEFEHMLEAYYEAFECCLRRVGVDLEVHTFEAFRQEVKRVAYIQVPHVIFMTRFILADSPVVDDAETEEIPTLTDVLKNTGSERISRKLSQILNLAQKFDILY